jgi:mono/diheme cytochrome c family protein
VLLALSAGQKTGIAVVAAVFIGFALVSSFVLPRRDPDFPGRRLGLFVGVTVLLFVSMLTAMAVLAVEPEEEAAGHGTEPAETHAPATDTGETTAEEEPAGDPEAGADVYESAGCGDCHTLAAAGSAGQIGPNLDDSKPSFDLVVDRVTNGAPPMPAFGDQLDEEQIRDVAAYVVDSTGGG